MIRELNNGKYGIYKGDVFDLSFVDNQSIKLIDRNKRVKDLENQGFQFYNNVICYKIIDKEVLDSAFEVATFCDFNNNKYYLENIWDNKLAVLSPELETKKNLGLNIYDDRRIEVDLDEFINNVKTIWEERNPIEGFKFDVEPTRYIKKDGVYL